MASSSGLKLHLGCGSTVVPGWENIDKSPTVTLARVPGARRALRAARVLTAEQANAVFPRGIVHVDVRRGLPYPDGAARYVYSSHMIEHVARDDHAAALHGSPSMAVRPRVSGWPPARGRLRRRAGARVPRVGAAGDRAARAPRQPLRRSATNVTSLRIAVLTTSYPRAPGDSAGRFVRDAVEHVRARGVEVEVVSPASFGHFGIPYRPGVVGNRRRRPWLALALPL